MNPDKRFSGTMFQNQRFVIALTAIWLVVVCAGTAAIWKYSMTPGEPAEAPASWPAAAPISTNPDLHTLVMLVHPRCSCSRASMAELAKIMTRLEGKIVAHVLFMKPSDFEDDWEKTDLWKRAVEIPGVTAVLDVDGKGAAQFGARTSGQVVVYSPVGELVYSGGITSGRAHEGDNIGESRLISLVNDRHADANHAAVYGCQMTH